MKFGVSLFPCPHFFLYRLPDLSLKHEVATIGLNHKEARGAGDMWREYGGIIRMIENRLDPEGLGVLPYRASEAEPEMDGPQRTEWQSELKIAHGFLHIQKVTAGEMEYQI